MVAVEVWEVFRLEMEPCHREVHAGLATNCTIVCPGYFILRHLRSQAFLQKIGVRA